MPKPIDAARVAFKDYEPADEAERRSAWTAFLAGYRAAAPPARGSDASLAAAGDRATGENQAVRAALQPVYTWLVETLGYPFDIRTDEKPGWLDVDTLAAAWLAKDNRKGSATDETVADYRGCIYDETGWPEAGARSGARVTAPDRDYPGANRHAMTHETRGPAEIITAPLDVDVYSAGHLRAMIADLVNVDGRHRLIIDLTATEYLDSTGLGVIVGALKRVRAHDDGALIVACAEPRILRVFEMTGLIRVFDIEATLDDALYTLGAGRGDGGTE